MLLGNLLDEDSEALSDALFEVMAWRRRPRCADPPWTMAVGQDGGAVVVHHRRVVGFWKRPDGSGATRCSRC